MESKRKELPLLIKTNTECPDVAHIVRGTFQENLTCDIISKNIIHNAEKYKSENCSFHHETNDTNKWNESFQSKVAEISQIEEKLMNAHGKVLIINKDESNCQRNSKLLKRYKIFDQLNSSEVKKYNLIQANDLLPCVPKQMIDFQLNPAKHGCTGCEKYILNLHPTKLGDFEYTKQCIHDRHETKMIERSANRKRKLQRRPSKFDGGTETVLQATPKRITFSYYEINKVYTQTFKVRNISGITRTFVIYPLRLGSPFKVELISPSTKVAPGISAQFKVTFCTNIYNDTMDKIVILASNGSVLKIELFSCRNAPVLRGFVIQTSTKFYYTKMDLVDFEMTDRHYIVNSTLDCGFCFIGDTNILNVLLLNEGGPGSFFIMTENDWFSCNIDDISSDLVLKSDCFEIFPAYFQLKKGEVVDLEVTFFPTSSGLQLTKLFLICDNCIYQELDVIGDGVYYDSSFILIQVPSKSNVALTNDDEAKRILILGEAVPNSIIGHTITIQNKSCMDIRYRWEIRSCSTKYEFNKKNFHKIKKEMVNIGPKGIHLPADSTTDFKLEIKTTPETGTYCCVLGLVLVNIPQAGLIDGQSFTVYDKNDAETCPHLLDILVEEIEICYDSIEIQIKMYPQTILVPFISHNSEPIIREITLQTQGTRNLDCEWIREKKDIKCVKIKPKIFTVSPVCKYICEAMITFNEYYDVEETFCLHVNGGIQMEKLTVKVYTEKPKIELRPEFINFGYVKKDTVYMDKISLKNVSETEIKWIANVFVFNPTTHEVENKDSNYFLSSSTGVLEGIKDSVCEFYFKLDTTNCGKFLAFLSLTTYHPSQTTTSCLCFIAAHVAEPRLKICAPHSEHGILWLNEVLHLGIPFACTVQLLNESELPCGFAWGKDFFGEQTDCLEVSFNPRCGVIGPRLLQDVQVTVKPTTTGLVDEFYVPCYIGELDVPILRIMCIAEGFRVKICLPDPYGLLVNHVLWPDEFEEDGNLLVEIEKYMETGIAEGEEKHGGVIITEITENIDEIKWLKECSRPESTLSLRTDGFKHQTSAVLSQKSSSPPQTIHSKSGRTSSMQLNMVQRDSEIRNLMAQFMNVETEGETDDFPKTSSEVHVPESLRNNFHSHPYIKLKKHSMELIDVTAREAVKVNVAIENLTPIRGCVEMYSKNFYAISRKSQLDNLLCVMKQKDTDWEDKIHDRYGCVVVIEPPTFILNDNEYKEIDIWVYGNTWGTYVDEIVCEIEDSPSFVFNLIFNVHGYPIEFPFAKNTITECPTVRLGRYAYTPIEFKRQIQVRNRCSLPLKVIWHIFLSNFEHPAANEKEPLNFLIDMFSNSSASKENEMHTMITNYYGTEDFELLQITPREMPIAPLSCAYVTLSINPYEFLTRSSKYIINAVLIGHVYIDKDIRIQEHCIRNQSPVDTPTVVKILGDIELPCLDFELLGGDLQFDIYATNVVGYVNETYRKEHRLVFKNNGKAFGLVSVKAESPLVINRIVTDHSLQCAEEPSIIVPEGSYMEVHVDCHISSKTINQMADWIYMDIGYQQFRKAGVEIVAENILKLSPFLTICHGGVKKQFVIFDVFVYFPFLLIDHPVLNFGVVFVGNSSDLIVTLTNKLGCETPFEAVVTNKEILRVEPSAGVIPAGTHNGTTLEIRILFEPNKSAVYMEEITIISNVLQFKKTIEVNGVGSHNEKYQRRIRE